MQESCLLEGIKPLYEKSMIEAKERMDNLVKPIGSLGKLEKMAIKLSGITGELYNHITKKAVIIMCSDNGVCEEGVASAPQIVTATQTVNFIKGVTGVGVLARHNNCDLKVVDIGVNEEIKHSELINRKIRKGTSNIAKGEAMTREEALTAIRVGIDLVLTLKKEGYNLIGTGEMGIGNTTSSSSILIALTGCSIEEAVGRGAGLIDEAFEKKKKVIKKVLEVNTPNSKDPIEVLHKVGGFDIAGLVGVYLGAAKYRIPVVIDGFISAIAALIAYRINNITKDFMFPSHISMEKGYNLVLSELGLEPILDLSMRLGEGSGCPLAFNILEASTKIMNEMSTFEEGNVDLDDYKGLWEEKI
ncbi:nicotinate-nucleotide--dimethylbenzimidazole phosphoribosyltransferase [Clostridium folliculivorans]|uniref:Nicotinate-nucleotide--dimethylbenzimidazole phosphoribosyltransferase n=1 Tax=Clostridium folliculivorans TaxID=2886038 RepID=A0A9W5Y5A4_9CLOT|nr:nicotinate-nucleotide--dimethylbenzimidazole phosphoribosyltransferase [Clostridium folliculivorans]GKU26753.1 nicotinate-nucleotide--dimethylbenzimidazole phosphoribosyltransferase [Clostridium folliculivorans]GKU31347.1 nicotinate-nucleotide--dimethylbenzimidazole phosphoribosyltransferase [Clostridium folliculivorans]